jgi:hypothetical protein
MITSFLSFLEMKKNILAVTKLQKLQVAMNHMIYYIMLNSLIQLMEITSHSTDYSSRKLFQSRCFEILTKAKVFATVQD